MSKSCESDDCLLNLASSEDTLKKHFGILTFEASTEKLLSETDLEGWDE